MSRDGGESLRIYYGDARIIIPPGDPRVQTILAMCLKGLPLDATNGTAVPRNDAEFLAVAAAFFRRRQTHG